VAPPARALSFGPDDPRLPRILELFRRHFVVPEDPEACWEWTGYTQKHDYGCFRIPGRGSQMAHRVSHALFKGPLRAGDWTIDHLCRNRSCVNPAHLEEVTHAENLRRRALNLVVGEPCPKGDHAFVPRGEKPGLWFCKHCYNEKRREYERAYRPAYNARKRQEREAA
jgi:hypothetical protein